MKKEITLFFYISLVFYLGKMQTIDISSCAALQSMQINNSTVVYNITQDIYCNSVFSTIGDGTNSFNGKIEGNNFTIYGINITSSSLFVGLFASGKDCSVSNLSFQNVTIQYNQLIDFDLRVQN